MTDMLFYRVGSYVGNTIAVYPGGREVKCPHISILDCVCDSGLYIFKELTGDKALAMLGGRE